MTDPQPSDAGRTFLAQEHLYLPNIRQRRHAHGETSITLVIAGALCERVGAVEEIARPLSIVVKPSDTEHANEFGEQGANTLQIVIPESMHAELVAWERPLTRWRWHHAGPATPAFLHLLRRVREATSIKTEDVQEAVVEAISAIAAVGATPAAGRAPLWLRHVREQLDDSHYRISVRLLADHAQTHPVYLARQFRRWYGCSITEYNRRRRTQWAATELANGARNLSSVSQRSGFTDHAQMCRLFKRETGMTPSAFRQATRSQDQRNSEVRYGPDMLAPTS